MLEIDLSVTISHLEDEEKNYYRTTEIAREQFDFRFVQLQLRTSTLGEMGMHLKSRCPGCPGHCQLFVAFSAKSQAENRDTIIACTVCRANTAMCSLNMFNISYNIFIFYVHIFLSQINLLICIIYTLFEKFYLYAFEREARKPQSYARSSTTH